MTLSLILFTISSGILWFFSRKAKSKFKKFSTLFMCMFFILSLIFLIVVPFVLEDIILCESIWPFNIKIYFSKETWFSFLGSYIGAISTIALGIFSLYQNKRYKDLADSSTEKMNYLVNDIHEIIWKNNIPITLISNDSIQELSLPPNQNGNLKLEFKNSSISKETNSSLVYTKKYTLTLKNQSPFPIQSIDGVKLLIRDKNNNYISYLISKETLQGYVDSHSSIDCEIYLYDEMSKLSQYNEKLLDICLTLRITDSKNFVHDKQFHLVSTEKVTKDNQTYWKNIIILFSKINHHHLQN